MVAVRPGSAARHAQTGSIHLIESDPFLLHSLSACLRRHGFAVSTTAATADAFDLVAAEQPSLVLVGLTHRAGAADICRRLRALTDAPLYVLTDQLHHHDHADQPAGIAGVHLIAASDETDLVARMHAALRRMNPARSDAADDVITIGTLEICPTARTVTKRGRALDLSPIEFRLLAVLVREQGKAVADRRLLTEVWGPDYADDVQNLRIFIRYLRAKIEDDPNHPRYILTEWDAGYRIVSPEE